MQSSKLICNNFSGINRSSSLFSSSVITASDMQNVELFATGLNSGVGIRTAKGNVSVCDNVPEGEQVVDIYECVQKQVTYFFVYTESSEQGKIYLLNPEDGELTLKVSGLTVTGKSCATPVSQGWSDLWVFSNGEEMLSVEIGKVDNNDEPDEVTMMQLTDMEDRTVKGLGIVVFDGRLWVFNNQILWYSVQENIYDFSTSDAEIATSAGYIEFVKNITAIYPYLGSLAVFHPNSSCMIALDDSTQSYCKTYEWPGGCAGAKSLVFHGTQLFFYDNEKKGVYSFLQVINGDKTLGENIALDIQDEIFSIAPSLVSGIKALSVVTSDKNEVWFLLPEDDEEHSTIMIYDYLHKAWIKRKSQKINCFNVINGVLYSAGNKVYKEYESSLFDGEFIGAFYNCTPLNFGVEISLKILAYPPKVSMDMLNYHNNFYVKYERDYNAFTTKIRHITSKTFKDVLRFDRGSKWDETYFPPEKINVIKRLPSAYFKTLRISFYTENKNQNFSISNIEFGKVKSKE